ncbi:hypothetical protein I4U23_012531 [Adineta vaga]|nr:hypothetical protein I4U23_012531 [Adineta vaga]
MRWVNSSRRLYICVLILIIYIILIAHVNYPRLSFYFLEQNFINIPCSQPIDDHLCKTHSCSHQTSVKSIIWTHDGTGLMKYIQWILTRKLGNIRITHLDENCCIRKEKSFPFNLTDQPFVQIYIVSLSAHLSKQSACTTTIHRRIKDVVNHIYFKRKSVTATVVFQHLDMQKSISISDLSYFQAKIDKATEVIKSFQKLFDINPSTKWKIINSEELIHKNLDDCEKSLIDFIVLSNISNALSKEIVQYDSHRFIEDALWWDRSDVAEHVLNNSIPSRSSQFTYLNDFYYLHGNRSFTRYLIDNRQCYNDGIFAQMQSETFPNRLSTDNIDRCLVNEFDCAFSDLYSFKDREQLYSQSNYKSIKCGFAIPSIFDIVRKRYGRNHTCETIVFTSIINCYDPLPSADGGILSSFCYVALVDTKTWKALKNSQSQGFKSQWDLIDLGNNASLFNFPAKTIETLKTVGQRMFPLAKWIIWLDGKAHLMNIVDILRNTPASIFSARHSELDRTSAIEVNYTIERIRDREGSSSIGFKRFVMDIKRQEAEYKRDGFYSRSDAMNIRMYDIAMFFYRNNHPCNFRYLCGWHNEINYFAYRGQLSVYYAAVRLNITHHFDIIPRKYYHTYAHNKVC